MGHEWRKIGTPPLSDVLDTFPYYNICKKHQRKAKGRLKKKHDKLGFLAEVRGGEGSEGFQGPNLLMVII